VANKTRICKTCKIEKLLDEFEKQHGKWYRRECKMCRSKRYEKCRQKYYCKSYFGMSIKEYENIHKRLFKIQNGKCYLCGKSNCVLRLDHSHKTGNVRTLLCEHCNLFAGKIEKDLDFVNSIIKYIEDFDG